VTRRVRALAANAALVVASTAAMIGLLEVGVRILRPQPLAAVSRSPRLGWTHKPNTQFVFERSEFRLPVRFSSAGLRDREFTVAKPAGTYRIAMLGDSFVEALQVPLDSCAAKRLERSLNTGAPPGRSYEVMNFGVTGYGTCQQLLLLEEQALRFHPDLVVSQYYFNDLDDDARCGFCSLGTDGEVTVLPPARLSAGVRAVSALKSFLYQHSELWMYVSTRRLRPRAAPPVPSSGTGRNPPADDEAERYEAGGEAVPTCPGHHKTLEGRLTLVELPADAARALAQTASTWARMQAECAAANARFVVVLGVSKPQLQPQLYARSLHAAGCSPAAHDIELPAARLRAAAAGRDVDVVDLLPAFRASPPVEALHFRIDGHWSTAGHRVAAAALCRALQERGILNRPSRSKETP